MLSQAPQRRLEVEYLEPRLYLSAGLPSDAVGLALDRPTDVPEVAVLGRSSHSQADVLLVDLNGVANPADALLATFDAGTGKLIAALPVAGGELLLTNGDGVVDDPAGRSDQAATEGNQLTDLWQADAFLYLDSDVATIANESLGVRGNSANRDLSLDLDGTVSHEPVRFRPAGSANLAIAGNGLTFQLGSAGAATVELAQDDAALTAAADEAAAASAPIVVAFPSGTLPQDFNVFDAVAAGNPPAAPASQRPAALVIAPGPFDWLSRLSASPWHSRALDRSSVDRLLGSGPAGDPLGDDSVINRAGGEFGGVSHGSDFTSSRVLLRSPVRTLVFKTPAEPGPDGRSAGAELATFNFATGQLTRTGRAVTGPLVPTAGRVAFLSPVAIDGSNLGGDAALDAQVLQLFDPTTGGIRNTSIRAAAIRLLGGQLVVAVSESTRAESPTAPATPGGRFSYYAYDVASGRLTGLRVATDQWALPADRVPTTAAEWTSPPAEPRPTDSADAHGRTPWRPNPAAVPVDDRGRPLPPPNVAFTPPIPATPANPPKPATSSSQHAQESTPNGQSSSAAAEPSAASDGASAGGEE